jgi:dUTP pyrophosphatase
MNFVKLDPRAIPPKKNLSSDACYDLFALEDCIIPTVINNYSVVPTATKIKTGIALDIPKGHAGFIHDRSGMGFKMIKVFGGVIDVGYFGDISVLLVNYSPSDYNVRAGDRIAQIAIQKIENFELVEVESLSDSERGTNGFGSSGV